MENALTILGLVVFVYLAYRAGKILNAFKHRRFTHAWQPLVGIINGAVHEDPQGGGASSWLAGQWKGNTIHARMTPEVHRGGTAGGSAGPLVNEFAVGVADQKGRASWTAERGFALNGKGDIAINSKDAALAERLRGEVVALLEAAQCGAARFEHHSGYVFVQEDVTPLWAPPPERFKVLLDLAVEVARVQAAVNTL